MFKSLANARCCLRRSSIISSALELAYCQVCRSTALFESFRSPCTCRSRSFASRTSCLFDRLRMRSKAKQEMRMPKRISFLLRYGSSVILSKVRRLRSFLPA